MSEARAATVPTTIIESTAGWVPLNLPALWEYHELLYFLILRDLQVRYKQTVIGVGWAVVQPLCTMVIFSIFFGKLGRLPSDGLPYPVFTYCALLPWQLFANAMTMSGNSLVTHQNLITKVYFPRLVIPVAAVLAGLVDFAIAFVILIALMAWYGLAPTTAVWTLPGFVVLAVVASLGIGLWLSALNVKYRDVRHVIPFLTQVWLFVTPIAYASSMVPARWRALYGLNPMVGVVEGFRWALLGQGQWPPGLIASSTLVALLLLISGLYYFRRTESAFADII